MDIFESTSQYDRWLQSQLAGRGLATDAPGLGAKRRRMAEASHSFLRATYYRWTELWPQFAPSEGAPVVLSVGDLHAENFGTWLDAEGRLVWGVNDFDEAAPLPYTNDLVRLATSVLLARDRDHFKAASRAEACGAILRGYATALEAGRERARPFVLAEKNEWLRSLAQDRIREPDGFWHDLKQLLLPDNQKRADDGFGIADMPRVELEKIERSMPAGTEGMQWAVMQSGLGSLGRPRVVGVGTWNGGRIAREAKAHVPFIAGWPDSARVPNFVSEILETVVRSGDPFYAVSDGWLVRRLAPESNKLELSAVPKAFELKSLEATGRETAHIHLGSADAMPAVRRHLEKLPNDWLLEAAGAAAATTRREWKLWCAEWPRRYFT